MDQSKGNGNPSLGECIADISAPPLHLTLRLLHASQVILVCCITTIASWLYHTRSSQLTLAICNR